MWSPASRWELFPRWLKRLSYVVGVPAWLAIMVMAFSGAIPQHRTVFFILFGAFGAVGMCQTVFVARALLRKLI